MTMMTNTCLHTQRTLTTPSHNNNNNTNHFLFLASPLAAALPAKPTTWPPASIAFLPFPFFLLSDTHKNLFPFLDW